MTNQEPQVNTIFGSIAYYNENQLNELIDNMNFEQSLFYVIQALDYAYKSGVFTLKESEIVSKSMRVLTSKPTEEK